MTGRADDQRRRASGKAPAFQFYPKDLLSDGNVSVMTNTELGVYTRLLCHCWLERSLPGDMDRLARLAREPGEDFARMWITLAPCFERRADENGPRFYHPRLEAERRKQAKNRRVRQLAARKRWQPGHANALHKDMQNDAFLSSSATATAVKKEEEGTSGATRAEATPVVLTFPVDGKPSTWDMHQAHVDDWHAAYPTLDVMAECRKAKAWLDASPDRRKTARGMPRFLVNWFGRAVNTRPSLTLAATGTDGRGRTGKPFAGKYDGIEEA